MDLFSHLNWYYDDLLSDEGEPIKSIPTGKLIVIADTLESDGSFLIHYFLQSIFKNNQIKPGTTTTNTITNTPQTCLLLGLNQSLYNYFNIGRKLGYNLTNENSKSNFSFINALSNPYQWIRDQRVQQLEDLGIEDEPPLDSISQGFNPFPVIQLINSNTTGLQSKSNGNQEELKQVLQKIYHEFVNYHKKSIEKNKDTRVYFIIDSLNILTSYHHQASEDSFILLMNFLQYCNSYVKENASNCTLIALFHSDCDDDSKFFNLLQYESDLTINCHGLKSGYSKDIDGQIDFLLKDNNDTFQRPNSIHYQVLDNNIRYFSLGSRI